MPGAGKSSIGVMLAHKTSKKFLDTDSLIETSQKRSLQDIVDNSGYMELRRIEEHAILQVNCANHVISTGGSAAYSNKAMMYLKENGISVFLDVNLKELQHRIHNFNTRGLAKRDDQTFEQLYKERKELYLQYADIIVESSYMGVEQTCQMIVERIKASSPQLNESDKI